MVRSFCRQREVGPAASHLIATTATSVAVSKKISPRKTERSV